MRVQDYELAIPAPLDSVTDEPLDPLAPDPISTRTTVREAATTALPDLTISPLSTVGTTFSAGASVTVNGTIHNVGSGAAGQFYTRIYLSADNHLGDANDTFLVEDSTPSLAASISSSFNNTVTLPSNLAPGQYYIGAWTDYNGQISESSEENNANATLITVAAAGASDTVLDTTSTSGVLTLNGNTTGAIEATLVTGSANTSFDHDWFRVSLTQGHSYSFSAKGTSGSLNDVAIDLRSSSGALAHSVVDGGANGTASFTINPTASGTYFLAISAGGSNPAGLTGVYQITATDNGMPGATTDTVHQGSATTNTLAVNGSVTGAIDSEPLSSDTGVAPSDGAGGYVDKDWYQVTLAKGQVYAFTGHATSITTGLVDISLYGTSGSQAHGLVEGGDPTFTFDTSYQTADTQTYYAAVSAGGADPAWRTATGGYTLNLSGQAAPTSTDTVPGSIQTQATLGVGTIQGTIDASDLNGGTDDDYYKVTLQGGEKYSFFASAGVNASDTLSSVIIRLRDSAGDILSDGDKTAVGSNPDFDYIVPGVGAKTFYLAVSAAGEGAQTATGRYSATLQDDGRASAPTHISITAKYGWELYGLGAQYTPPDIAAFKQAVELATGYFEREFIGNVNLEIHFGWNEVSGMNFSGVGGSTVGASGRYVTYAEFRNALGSNQGQSLDDQLALRSLPLTDPTGAARSNWWLSNAQLKALGLPASSNPVDGWIGLSSGSFLSPNSYSYDGHAATGTYDAVGALEHEISEVMGRIGYGGSDSNFPFRYSPADLFRYVSGDHSGNPDVSALSGFFSVDGTQLSPRAFNNTYNGGVGDRVDWGSVWQLSDGKIDAFGVTDKGLSNEITDTDLKFMDVLGWNLASPTVDTVISVSEVQDAPLKGSGGFLVD